MIATFFRRGEGRSLNAISAENDGRHPLTRAVAALAAEAEVSKASAKIALEKSWGGEWHHVGKYAQECKYYAVAEGIAWLEENLTQADRDVESRKFRMARARAEKAAATRGAKKAEMARISAEREAADRAVRAEQSRMADKFRADRRAWHMRELSLAYIADPTAGRAQALRAYGVNPNDLIAMEAL